MIILRSKWAWAIDSGSPDYRLLGQFYHNPKPADPQYHGIPCALFSTRRAAADALRSDKAKGYVAFPRARVVRVLVEVCSREPAA